MLEPVRSPVAVTIVALALVCAALKGAAAAPGPDRRLVDAARQRDAKAARQLIRGGIDVNARQSDGSTALHWAAHWDDLDLAQLLVQHGSRVEARNEYGVMPLSLAATNGSGAMIQILLKAGARPNAALPSGESVLMTAARTGRADAVRALVDAGADVNARESIKGQTALMWAVSQGHLEVVRLLLARGAVASARTNAGFTALMFAAREGRTVIARVLLDSGEVDRLNESADDGSTPLLIATVRGHLAVAMLLLDEGAAPDGDLERAGFSPLHWAAGRFEGRLSYDYQNAGGEWAALAGIPTRDGKLALVSALLTQGARVDAQATKAPPRYGFSLFKQNYLLGATPFHFAAQAADVDVMRLLLAAGADPNAIARDNTTPLILAAGLTAVDAETHLTETDNLAAIAFLVSVGARADAVNHGGFSAMHAAAFAGYNAIIQYLFERGAAISDPAKNGQTPLGIAEGNTLNGFFFARPATAAVLRRLGAVSQGAVTLESTLQRSGVTPGK